MSINEQDVFYCNETVRDHFDQLLIKITLLLQILFKPGGFQPILILSMNLPIFIYSN